MKQLLKSLFFFLTFIASAEAQIPGRLTAYPLPDQGSAITESLVTLGVLALSQQVWQPLLYNPEKGTKPEPYNNPFLHVSSDDPFIISGPEPVPDYHTLCQPIDPPDNKTWQCFGLESITSVALDTQQSFYLKKTHSHQSMILRHTYGPKLTFSEDDLSNYQTVLKNQQAEMERIDKIATKEIAMGRLKIRIAEETTDEDTARRVYIAKTNGITVKEQKDIEQEAKRQREDARAQSDGYAPSAIDLPDDTVLCLASNRKACQEVLSKIVSSADSEPDKTSENTSPPSQESEQDASEGQETDHTSEDGSVATASASTTDDLALAAKKQKPQQSDSDSELAENDPQQLLNQYPEKFFAMHTPSGKSSWLHAIRVSSGRNVSTLVETLIKTIDDHLADQKALTETFAMFDKLAKRVKNLFNERSAFLSRWITAQGERNVQLLRQQLFENELPDLNILLPLLSYLSEKTFVVVNLHASGLAEDQVFTYATPGSVQVSVVSESSAINTSGETIYLGLLSRDNHFVGIQPGTKYDIYSHYCSRCTDLFTKNSTVKSTNCFHYLCENCFDVLNQPPVWECPKCRNPQECINPKPQRRLPQLACGCRYCTDNEELLEKHQWRTHGPFFHH
ncbi:hypothetical protein [Endozoicomonas sp. 4G]|uniref:hypothetical protein n=1 Tax=Endozoicomonas sp. 4G TaxID=2872754 RepID=UPI00207874F7|nr:hypothetical protein [Endozoicomonas sp. 4G]